MKHDRDPDPVTDGFDNSLRGALAHAHADRRGVPYTVWDADLVRADTDHAFRLAYADCLRHLGRRGLLRDSGPGRARSPLHRSRAFAAVDRWRARRATASASVTL